MNRHCCLVVLSLALTASAAFSQSTFGSILGALQDKSGGIIAGGEIEITNLDENTTRKTTSNDSGIYQFLNFHRAGTPSP